MPGRLRVLIVEDCQDDAALLVRELRRGRWDVVHDRVDTPQGMAAALNAHPWDLIIADHSMPNFSGPAALAMVRERSADIPFILVSGHIGEETAVQAMQAGADDYLFKGDLKRLVPTVERELQDLKGRRKAEHTERQLQKGERQLADAQRLAHLGTWHVDLRSNVAVWSDEACRILGCPVGGECLTFQQFLDFLDADDRKRINGFLASSDQTLIAHDCRIACPNAAAQFVHVRGEIIRDENGVAIEATGMIQDITERQLVDAQLQQAKEVAEAANRAKSAFLANMSHELRTPMSAILGFADMMSQTGPGTPDHNECIQVIQRNSHHLLQLINEILDLSKIEAGQMTVEGIQCDLPALLIDVIALMRPRAAEKSLQLNVAIDGCIPRHVRTDALKFRQILINLLGNAIKFTAAGTIEMVMRCEPSGQTSKFTVEIRDTGIGMTLEQMNRVFEPFAQAEQSTTRKFGGTGLGLAISRRLARLLQGDITVSSVIGTGSVFTVSIEAGSVENTETVSKLEDSCSPTGVTEESPKDNAISARVLLVEDGRDNQRLLSTHLKMAGAEVEIAEDGRIAVELCNSHVYDLILMDMQMPVMDGYSATAELRRRGVKTPIIALTAYAMPEDREKCLAIGCTDYLTKPIDRDVLLASIRHHLDPPAQRDKATAPALPMEPTPNENASGVLHSSIASMPGMAAVVSDFVRDLPKQVDQLRSLLESRELDPLRRLAHQLRGACGGYGFDAITEVAEAAEASIKTGQSPIEISARVNSLIQIIRRVEGYDKSEIRPAA